MSYWLSSCLSHDGSYIRSVVSPHENEISMLGLFSEFGFLMLAIGIISLWFLLWYNIMAGIYREGRLGFLGLGDKI